MGLPDRMSSDNGREFVDKTGELILQTLGIKQHFRSSVSSPASRGLWKNEWCFVKIALLKSANIRG